MEKALDSPDSFRQQRKKTPYKAQVTSLEEEFSVIVNDI